MEADLFVIDTKGNTDDRRRLKTKVKGFNKIMISEETVAVEETKSMPNIADIKIKEPLTSVSYNTRTRSQTKVHCNISPVVHNELCTESSLKHLSISEEREGGENSVRPRPTDKNDYYYIDNNVEKIVHENVKTSVQQLNSDEESDTSCPTEGDHEENKSKISLSRLDEILVNALKNVKVGDTPLFKLTPDSKKPSIRGVLKNNFNTMESYIDLSVYKKIVNPPWKNKNRGSMLETDVEISPQIRTILPNKLSDPDKLLKKKGAMRPGFLAKTGAVKTEISKRQRKRKGKKLKERSKGKDWFDMKPPEMTDEKRSDLLVIKYRDALDPKHFYKRSDMKGLPKYYQVGRVISQPADFYSSRLTKKERKATIVDELLADKEFQETNKRRFKDVMEKRMARKGRKPFTKQQKKVKRKKKKLEEAI